MTPEEIERQNADDISRQSNNKRIWNAFPAAGEQVQLKMYALAQLLEEDKANVFPI